LEDGLAHERVLRDGYAILEEAMDEDDVDTRELGVPLHLLEGDLADVSDELQLQLPRLSSPVACADAIRLELELAREERTPDRGDHVREGRDLVVLRPNDPALGFAYARGRSQRRPVRSR
jgi:hypothetical protein